MATIESFDFEGGEFPAELSGTNSDPAFVEVSGTSPLTGSYSIRWYSTAATANRAYVTRASFGSTETNVYFQFKFRTNQRVNHNASGFVRLFTVTIAGVGARYISLTRDGSTADEYIGTIQISPDTTYVIETHLQRDSSTGGLKTWVDGVEASDAQSGDVVGSSVQSYEFGSGGGSGPITSGLDARIDDIVVSTTYIGVSSLSLPHYIYGE